MRFHPSLRVLLRSCAGAALAGWLAGCTPAGAPSNGPLRLETRADGLTYAVGAREPFSGKFIALNKDGTIHYEQTYENGIKHGHWQIYTDGGKPKRRKDYVNGGVVREREWHPNGQLKSDESMKDGVCFGLCTFWFDDGRIHRIMNFGDGFALHGQAIEFSKTGELVVDVIYCDGAAVSGKGVRLDVPATPPTTAAPKGKNGMVAEAKKEASPEFSIP